MCGESFTSRAALLVLHLNFSHLVELTLLSVSFVTRSAETHTKYVLECSFYLKQNFTLIKTGFSWDVVAKKEVLGVFSVLSETQGMAKRLPCTFQLLGNYSWLWKIGFCLNTALN